MTNGYYRGQIVIGNRILVARTCLMCGRFLEGKYFMKKKNGRASSCTSCIGKRNRKTNPDLNIYAKRVHHREQDRSLNSATKARQIWTLKELDRVVKFIELGIPQKRIAIIMNRSYYSIHMVIHNYGLKNNWPTREQWIIAFTNKGVK